MEAPKTVEDIFERKEVARSRFNGMTLIEKIERMFELKNELDKAFGRARREKASGKITGPSG